ncbi:MAG TPA: hypothetical protein EYN38_07250, partial [Flavobacteriales bacterium]|nr:hypothetical protein [Flavobacteriales bacterium]
MRNYCTYFDQNYAVRALTLIDSLNRFGGAYLLYTLCLDKDSQQIINALGNDHVVSVGLADLELLDQDLAATKATRSLIEYYFTITPCWPL